MKFFDDILCQKTKSGYSVCGDACMCERTAEGTVYVMCDGIGSGIYANIAALTCAGRIMELFRRGMSIRAASEMVACSMHRARTEDIPFSAFTAAVILPDGQFIIYTYETPSAILLQDSSASVLKPRLYTAGHEVIGEATGTLHMGDALILASDGITQAGLGHGYTMGIGTEGVVAYINRSFNADEGIDKLPERIVELCAGASEGRYEDDTTLALLHCREANQISVLTGPPSRSAMDHDYVETFISLPGRKVICGSTTTDIVARELGKKVETISLGSALRTLPEYYVEGIDLTTEGAIMLSQVCNILDEPKEKFVENSTAERFCIMLKEADVVCLLIGNAMNDAHDALLFKQIGVRVRRKAIRQIVDKLRAAGKLVTEKYY